MNIADWMLFILLVGALIVVILFSILLIIVGIADIKNEGVNELIKGIFLFFLFVPLFLYLLEGFEIITLQPL